MANKKRLALGLVLVVGLAACSSGSGGGGNLAAACKANLNVQDGFTELFRGLEGGPQSGPPSAAAKQQIKDTFAQRLAKPLADAEASAPDAIKADIKSAVASLRTFGDTGDPSLFNDPAFAAKGQKINLYFYDHCSGPKQAVGAADYKFSGVPNQLPSGVVQLKLTNSGTEEHEMLFVRRKPGVTETFDQLLALPQEQAQAKTEAVFHLSAGPGKPDATVVDLTPGQYAMICTISKGTVGDKQGDGPPHFTLGMKHEFTVA
ncbi:MAG: hypothetical protein M3Z84_03965 [Actinomycetota bacterium]|nr:hypothetical protein [Actinomycetota bacterium]